MTDEREKVWELSDEDIEEFERLNPPDQDSYMRSRVSIIGIMIVDDLEALDSDSKIRVDDDQLNVFSIRAEEGCLTITVRVELNGPFLAIDIVTDNGDRIELSESDILDDSALFHATVKQHLEKALGIEDPVAEPFLPLTATDVIRFRSLSVAERKGILQSRATSLATKLNDLLPPGYKLAATSGLLPLILKLLDGHGRLVMDLRISEKSLYLPGLILDAFVNGRYISYDELDISFFDESLTRILGHSISLGEDGHHNRRDADQVMEEAQEELEGLPATPVEAYSVGQEPVVDITVSIRSSQIAELATFLGKL